MQSLFCGIEIRKQMFYSLLHSVNNITFDVMTHHIAKYLIAKFPRTKCDGNENYKVRQKTDTLPFYLSFPVEQYFLLTNQLYFPVIRNFYFAANNRNK